MTSYPSNQDQAFHDTGVANETNNYYYQETVNPSESDVNRPPQKQFSFNDKLDSQEGLVQKAQALSSNNNYLQQTNYSTTSQPISVDSGDLNNRLDKLLKSAETALHRGKTRGGSISAHHQVSSPIFEIDSALTFNASDIQKRTLTAPTPGILPQSHSATSQPSHFSIHSAEFQNQTPISLTPNALSYRYSPSSQHPSQTLEAQYNLASSYIPPSETQKRAGTSPLTKYSPALETYHTNVYSVMDQGYLTSRSYTVVPPEAEQKHYQAATTNYDTQINNMNTLPRNYNLFPIRETERSSHVSNFDNQGGNDVSELKKGINHVEDMLRSLDNFNTANIQPPPSGGNHEIYARTVSAQNYPNIILTSSEPLYRENVSELSSIYPLKTREYETIEPPKRSGYAAQNSEFSGQYSQNQSYNNLPNLSASYSPKVTRILPNTGLEPQEKTQQAMKNIDHLMQKHIFQSRPLTRSTVGLNQGTRYMSPTRGSGGFVESYGERQWATTAGTQNFIQPESELREKEVRSYKGSYQGSIQTTPKVYINRVEEPKSHHRVASSQYEPKPSHHRVASSQYEQPKSHSRVDSSQYETFNPPKENTYVSPVKDLTLPRSYGSTTNYKEYLSSPRPQKPSYIGDDDYRSGLISSPLPPDQYDEGYKRSRLHFDQDITATRDYDAGYYNPEILNSADRKMKRLTLKAKSPEERDSERRDQFRYTPSEIKEVHGADYIFTENDTSQFDFRTSANEPLTDRYRESYRRESLKAMPNTFKAGELQPDRDDPSSQREVQPKAGDFQDELAERQNTQSSVNAFKAGDLQNDPDQEDTPRQNFHSGDLEDEPEAQKVPKQVARTHNVPDDGKAWQMVHRVDANLLQSVEQSFDFDATHSGHQSQLHQGHEVVRRSSPNPRDDEQRLQRILDPNLWIVNNPKSETSLNASKNSHMLKQSVKKAQKKPIITHCFEKYNSMEFDANKK